MGIFQAHWRDDEEPESLNDCRVKNMLEFQSDNCKDLIEENKKLKMRLRKLENKYLNGKQKKRTKNST